MEIWRRFGGLSHVSGKKLEKNRAFLVSKFKHDVLGCYDYFSSVLTLAKEHQAMLSKNFWAEVHCCNPLRGNFSQGRIGELLVFLCLIIQHDTLSY